MRNFGFIFYLYLIITILSLTLSMAKSFKTTSNFNSHNLHSNRESLSDTSLNYIKYFFCIIIAYSFLFIKNTQTLRQRILYNLYLSNERHSYKTTRFNRIVQSLFLWMCIINFMLITIVNPSMLNPGPTNTKNPIKYSVYYQNIQGLIPFSQLSEEHPTLHTSKIHELQLYLHQNSPDIVVLNETWLKKSILDNEIMPTDKYKIFRLDRTTSTHPPDPIDPKKFRRNGGGVLIGIKHNIDIVSNEIKIKCKAEILSIELTDKAGCKTIFSTFYRVGTLGTDNHNVVEKYLTTIRRRRNVKGIFLIGDLNFPKADWQNLISTDSTEQLFIDTFNNLSLGQMIEHPTHIKGNILDVLVTDCPQRVSNLEVLTNIQICSSDHFPIEFKVSLNAPRKKPIKRSIYNFKKANWEAINSDFSTTNWYHVLNSDDIETAWNKFKTKFFEICNKHIPKIKISNEFKPPWYDSDVFALDRKKKRSHSLYKKTGSDLHHAKFSSYRRELTNLIIKKMNANFDNLLNNINHIKKKFWSYVKSKTNSHHIPELVSYGNQMKSNRKDQCTLFNDFFCDQFSESSDYNIQIDFSNDKFYKLNFSEENIASLLNNLDSNKSQGPDEIHGRILKNCSSSLNKPLSLLFRKSYETSKIPNEWKFANVVPIHKKGSKVDVCNYRPISLISIVMKTYERIIRDELLNRCGHLIDDRQHGFMNEKSCCTQLVTFCDSLALTLNDNIRTHVIYFDFQKAFDSVNHDIILEKLKFQYGIDGLLLNFLVNYLKNRLQRVVIGNESSSYRQVISGVPQGSIIGPTLFVLFINDIIQCVTPGTNIALYADDTKIWRPIKTQDDHWILQKDINSLSQWATRNKMKFHPDKSKVLDVYNGTVCINSFSYTLNSKTIEYTPREKDLGVHIVPKLTWTEHSNILYSRANQRLGMLKRNCDFVKNVEKRRILFLAQVRSQFEHCPVVWQPQSKTVLNKLESVQKRGFKWILNDVTLPSFSSTSFYYHTCKQLNILPLIFRFKLKDLTFFHSIFYKKSVVKLPSYLSYFNGSRLRNCHLDNLCICSSVQPKAPQNLEILNTSTGITKSFFYRAHLIWNNLPLDLRKIESQSLFEKKLTDYLWTEILSLTNLPSDLLDELD